MYIPENAVTADEICGDDFCSRAVKIRRRREKRFCGCDWGVTAANNSLIVWVCPPVECSVEMRADTSA